MSREERLEKAKSYEVLGLPWWATPEDIDNALRVRLGQAVTQEDEAKMLDARQETISAPSKRKVDVLAYRLPLSSESLLEDQRYCFPNMAPKTRLAPVPGLELGDAVPGPSLDALVSLKGPARIPSDWDEQRRAIRDWVASLLEWAAFLDAGESRDSGQE